MSRRNTLIAGLTAAFAGIVLGIGLTTILTGDEQHRPGRQTTGARPLDRHRDSEAAHKRHAVAGRKHRSRAGGHAAATGVSVSRSSKRSQGCEYGCGSGYDCEYCGEDDYGDSYDSGSDTPGGPDVTTPGPAAAPPPDVSPAPPPAPAPPPDVIPKG